MRLSLILMVAMAAVVLVAMLPGGESAAARRYKRPLNRRIGRSRALATTRSNSPQSRRQRQLILLRQQQEQMAIRRAKKAAAAKRRRLSALRRQKKRQLALKKKASQKPISIRTARKLAARKGRSRYNRRGRNSLRRSGRRGRRRFFRRGRQDLLDDDVAGEGEDKGNGLENDIEIEDPSDVADLMADPTIDTQIEADEALQALDEAASDPNKREVVDADGDGVPDWCNPKKPMGAWLNFRNMKKWCVEKGYGPSFGPYGSWKAKEDEGEANGEELPLDGDVDPVDNALGEEPELELDLEEEELPAMEEDPLAAEDDQF